jgi:hypothetical protein
MVVGVNVEVRFRKWECECCVCPGVRVQGYCCNSRSIYKTDVDLCQYVYAGRKDAVCVFLVLN